MPTSTNDHAHRRTPKRLAIAVLAVLAVAGCRPGEVGPTRPSQPDVFLISIDTLRADHLGAYGYSRPAAPFLDQLANKGVVLENSIVATHGTTPSHASILMSVPQEVHGVGLFGRTDDRLPTSLPNLAELFRQAGYRTVAVTGGGNVGEHFGFARGFDVFDDGARGAESGRARLISHLSEISAEMPLFVFFHTYEVHTPYSPPPDLVGTFGQYESTFETSSRKLVEYAHRAGELEDEDLDHIRARYDEGIVHADRVLKSLFNELRQAGRLRDAIVSVTSDHGEEFGEHGGLVHRDLLYDELLRVPLIFWGPGLPADVSPPRSASSLDIAPTLASCAGLTVPDSWHGRDLLCSGSGSDETDDRALISQYGNRRYSVRTERWKLIVTRLEDGVFRELYDLQADPAETRNVADQHLEVVDELTRELRTWRAGLETVTSDGGPVELDPEERERLEALGYL